MKNMANAHRAVIAAADNKAALETMLRDGNPDIRLGAECIARIASMHSRNDYTTAVEWQEADQALYHLPMETIEILISRYTATHGGKP